MVWVAALRVAPGLGAGLPAAPQGARQAARSCTARGPQPAVAGARGSQNEAQGFGSSATNALMSTAAVVLSSCSQAGSRRARGNSDLMHSALLLKYI